MIIIKCGWKILGAKSVRKEHESTTITMPVNYIRVKSLFKEGLQTLINWRRSIFNISGREVMRAR